MPLLIECWAQSDLFSQGTGLEEWGDILVIVVMASLWLAGALAKAISTRKGAQQNHRQEATAKQQKDRRETWQERLARKAQEIQRAAEAKARQFQQAAQSGTQAKAPHKRQAAPQPPAGKITIRHGQKGNSVMVYERPASAPVREQVHERATQADVLARQEVAKPRLSEPTVEPPAYAAAPPSPEQSVILQAADILDFGDPDALRKAILHYEVIGRPLALRQPLEEASVF